MDPKEMPYDPITGKRADVVISPETTVNRMNFARVYEQTMKAAMVELEDWLYQRTNLTRTTPGLKEKVIQLDQNTLKDCFDRIEQFLYITVKTQYEWYKSLSFKEKTNDLYHVLKDHFYVYRPTDNPIDYIPMFDTLIKEGFLSPPHKLRFFNPYTGREEETTVPHRIGPLYYICLEKIGDDAAAVSTAATQPNGIIVPLTSKDKATQQTRKQATRFPAESENRLIVSGAPRGLAAEIHDRSNNPETVEHILHNIYATDKPTNIESVVDRRLLPLGGGRPLQYMNHLMQCGGYALAYTPFDPRLQVQAEIDPITGKVKFEVEKEDEETTKRRRRKTKEEDTDEDSVEDTDAEETEESDTEDNDESEDSED